MTGPQIRSEQSISSSEISLATERPLENPRGLFGQPPGLTTLFLTEMWERFTYYGMRSVLILFMAASTVDGGLGFDDRTASAIYGLYIAGTYVLCPIGGWIADRFIGPRTAVLAGGVLIMVGNALLPWNNVSLFFGGLLVIAMGVGLLKPNITVLVAELYPDNDSQRDVGFTILYMGINLGALLGPLLIPVCASRFGWSWGFSLPVLGMLFGVAQFLYFRGRVPPGRRSAGRRTERGHWRGFLIISIAIASVATALYFYRDTVNAVSVANWATLCIAILAGAYFAYILRYGSLSRDERQRIYVMIVLFIAYASFWAGFEQGGASLNFFAERHTDRTIFGWTMPAGMLQAATALFTIMFAPVFAALWQSLARTGRDPAPSVKFGLGLTLMGSGFAVMFVASQYVVGGSKVGIGWLLLTYLLHEWGDLCLSPVGFSAVTKLVPARFAGQTMGVWFLAVALGNNLAGHLSGEYNSEDLQSLPALFWKIFLWGIVSGAIMLLLTPVLRNITSKR